MLIECTRKIEFCAGHRVVGHESKCAHLHGHQYTIELTVRPIKSLDAIGRIVDFSVIKSIVKDWIDKHWDHGFILHAEDEHAIDALNHFATASNIPQKLYRLPFNPTAENLARYLLEKSQALFDDNNVAVKTTCVVVHETPNCYAKAI